MKRTTKTRTPKSSGGIGRGPSIRRSVRAAGREPPAFEEVVIRHPRRRVAIGPAFLDDDIRRRPGRLGMRAPRGRALGRRKSPSRDY